MLLLLILLGIGQIWYLAKDGFNINRVLCSLAVEDARIEKKEEIEALLLQPYRYLGRGRQCYAFESYDGCTVLKIPRLDFYSLPLHWQVLPFSFFGQRKRSIWENKQRRLAFVFDSFRIASLELASLTGVRYLHLHRTEDLPKELILYDQLHRRFCIDPNKTAFVLQIKVPLMMPAILNAVQKQDRKRAEEILDAFLMIIEERAKLGIFNKDPSFFKNFGLEKGKGIQIDIGSFYRKSGLSTEEAYRLSLEESTVRIREWLADLDPFLCIQFDQKLQSRLQKCLSKSSESAF